jgi:hypothetical protein
MKGREEIKKEGRPRKGREEIKKEGRPRKGRERRRDVKEDEEKGWKGGREASEGEGG